MERAEGQDPEIYRQILRHGGRFVPVVNEGRLERIVDAHLLARRLSLDALECIAESSAQREIVRAGKVA